MLVSVAFLDMSDIRRHAVQIGMNSGQIDYAIQTQLTRYLRHHNLVEGKALTGCAIAWF
jgi:hypothetical protein